MSAPDPLHLFRLLLAGETSVARLYFAGTPHVADPIEGVAATDAEWPRLLKAKSQWLRKHRARLQPLAVARTAARVIAEGIAHLRIDKRTVQLPVALAADLVGDKWTAVRIYHSLFPILGKRALRPPLLREDPKLVLPDVVGAYLRAAREGDVEGLLAAFGDSGYAREPSGTDQAHQGREALRSAYSNALSGGGVGVEVCTVTDDGVRVALETNYTHLGDKPLEPQAGLAVYERGPGGLLAAARFYNDVHVPADSATP